MGSLAGAFVASLVIGLLQTLPLTARPLVDMAANLGWPGHVPGELRLFPLLRIKLSRRRPSCPTCCWC
jgi:branched-chain amino acid transport system permease protein